MVDLARIHEGMPVYGTNDQLIGAVERREANGIRVAGQHIPASAIARVTADRVFLDPAADGLISERPAGRPGDRRTTAERVPIYEERVDVEKRSGQIGEVSLHKEVIEEQVSAPVELRREQIHVDERTVSDGRPVDVNADDLFKEQTFNVPLRGEEAVIQKETYVTGEVVIEKDRITEQRQVSDTVRREKVTVEERYQQARGDFREHYDGLSGAQGEAADFERAEPHYRRGFEVGADPRYANRRFDEVEPELRRDYERQAGRGDDRWERLRDQIREGFERARR